MNAETSTKFEKYADSHPMGGPVSDFERSFYRKYLTNFSVKILDIGCGDGKYVTYLESECKDSLVIPCDISFKRIQRVVEKGRSGVVGSGEKIPFKDKTFERVFLMQVIEHVPNPDQVISECERVLKPGGYFFVLTPNYPAKRFYDWIEVLRYRKWRKIWDDPTHCSKFSWTSLEQLLQKYFNQVEVVSTFILGEGRFSKVRASRDQKNTFAKLFSHKILAVCSDSKKKSA